MAKGYYSGYAYFGYVPSLMKYLQFESENEYTFNELENAKDRINQVATIINSYKDLSQYEKAYLAFSYVQSYEYKKCKE